MVHIPTLPCGQRHFRIVIVTALYMLFGDTLVCASSVCKAHFLPESSRKEGTKPGAIPALVAGEGQRLARVALVNRLVRWITGKKRQIYEAAFPQSIGF